MIKRTLGEVMDKLVDVAEAAISDHTGAVNMLMSLLEEERQASHRDEAWVVRYKKVVGEVDDGK
jgi:hypothetical protein